MFQFNGTYNALFFSVSDIPAYAVAIISLGGVVCVAIIGLLCLFICKYCRSKVRFFLNSSAIPLNDLPK